MNLIISLFCCSFTLIALSQNDVVKCKKTTWPLIGGYQIDSFNKDGKKLSSLMIDKNGDTTQYWKSIYDSQGILLREFSIIGKHQSFDYRYINDSINNLDLRISINKNGVDTIVIPKNSKQLNEFGDPLFHAKYGNIYYTYNSKKLKTQEICVNKSGDTTGIGHFEYDKLDNQISYKWFENQALTFSVDSDYDINKNLIHRIQKNGFEKMHEEFNLFDSNQQLYKSYGTDYEMKEPYNWEMIFEIIECK